MPLDDFGLDRLVKVSATDAIGGEALKFTPWLVTHIEALSEKVGLNLVFGEDLSPDEIRKDFTEVPVGEFRLDVMAHTDGERVVAIENQYGLSLIHI